MLVLSRILFGYSLKHVYYLEKTVMAVHIPH